MSIHSRSIFLVFTIITSILLTAWTGPSVGETPSKGLRDISGPLRLRSSNPRYFGDGRGEAVYLTGSHTWASFKDIGTTDLPARFDYHAYLNFLEQHNHNFVRLWTWELTKYQYSGGKIIYATPFPWPRTGPGAALDGKPKFDLSRFDQKYFDRLRARAIAARDHNVFVSIMLFEAHGMRRSDSPWCWDGHPFNVHNNINGVDGDPNKDGRGLESHTLQVPSIVKIEEDYVRKTIDTVNDLDNILYEISNSDHRGSIDWQYHLIQLVHDYEKTKPKQHPVGMTASSEIGNDAVLNSPADWISPRRSPQRASGQDPYEIDPPAAEGRKVILSDTDRFWGAGGNLGWVWKSFLRGLNPIFMDPYDVQEWQNHPSAPDWELIRKNMGYTLAFSRRMKLISVVPRNDLSSTTYCLSNPGKEYLIYLPSERSHGPRERVLADLSGSAETFRLEWFNPRTGETVGGRVAKGGGVKSFTAPFSGDAVLYIYKP